MNVVQLAHGGGGAETAALIREVFLASFGRAAAVDMADAAVVEAAGKIAFTTDSYVVRPLFFPGGDIGRLAVCGTVNDLLTTGARPLYLSAAFILETGLPLDDLGRICESMARAAAEAGVRIVTGDTKVVEGDGGLSIATSGVGVMEREPVRVEMARRDDVILLTGTLGDHHACILGQRMGLENGIRSDAAPLGAIVASLRDAGIPLHGIRDITRGGLATILSEIADAARLAPVIREADVPVDDAVASFAKILGLDPLYMANEGKAAIIVPGSFREQALEAIRRSPYGSRAACVGGFEPGDRPILLTRLGGRRLLPPARGEGLPRIC